MTSDAENEYLAAKSAFMVAMERLRVAKAALGSAGWHALDNAINGPKRQAKGRVYRERQAAKQVKLLEKRKIPEEQTDAMACSHNARIRVWHGEGFGRDGFVGWDSVLRRVVCQNANKWDCYFEVVRMNKELGDQLEPPEGPGLPELA